MRLSSRRSDDADVIRERLRMLLDERERTGGWLPEELAAEPPEPRTWHHDRDADDLATVPVGDGPGAMGVPDGIGRHRAPGREARWDPGRPGARSLWIAGLLAAVLLAGWTWLDRPRVEPVEAAGSPSAGTATAAQAPPVGEAAETSATVVVSVVGQVVRPGLVTLPSGSRVADAITAAGGLLPGADASSVNLAAPVADGEQLAVGVPAAAAQGSAPAAPGQGSRIDLNTAGVAELDALPGIGPVLAQRIVDHRDQQGPFRSVEELDDVPGIGPATAAELAELVTV